MSARTVNTQFRQFVICFICLLVPLHAAAAKPSDRLQQVLDKASQSKTAGTEWLDIVIANGGPHKNVKRAAAASGGQLRYQHGNSFEVRIPAGKAKGLLKRLPANSIARLPYPHTTTSVTGAGLAFTGGSDMHTLGFDGTGIKIGIIDLGFGGLAGAQASGDLPVTGSDLSILDYTGTGTGGSDHGTNVAEIIHDMLPGAKLKLMKIDSELQLSQATNELAAINMSQRMDVIVHAVSWFGGAFYDGTGSLCDITNVAETNGVLWVNSAGNWRNRHALGTFADNGAGRHEFTTGQDYTSVSLTSGSAATFTLNWDAYPTTTVDYDFYLYDGIPGSGGSVVASSQNAQSGTIPNYYPYPYEYISYTPSLSGTYYLVVEKAGGTTSNLPLSLFSPEANLDTGTQASSLAQPADCSTVFSVGATEVLTDTLKDYSSEGPTTDGRNKPEISGPVDIQTSQTGSFGGTSAAAPHVAAAAGLLLDKDGTLTLSQLRSELTTTAEDVSTPGFDFRTGEGRVSLDADGDGLNHDGEINSGSDPLIQDTDGDGLNDGDEVNFYGTDPTIRDTDGDGAQDNLEVTEGTDPLLDTSFPTDPDGDINGDGNVDTADLVLGTRILTGLKTPTSYEFLHGNVAPLIGGIPAPDTEVNAGDILILQQKIMGLVSF